ncbi:gliding motility protein SprC [Flavobacterium geliluteum]|uniref:Gliding motility protein SprC n=1 Tax=Flavobacterium geliluteum TaxID=2816120 RepID=A0A941B3Y0_9FLAO|nr:gliding motility protein SprC [Flavobacterium geliluteum]MBP4138988.1 gliding motility protein SprC [Flavobacterium geliluteum]
MIQKTTLFLTKCIIFFGAFFAFEPSTNAQTVVPQTFDGLEKLCAGGSFNEFFATFSYIDFPAGTTFVVELSDPTGSFTTPIATTLLQTIDVSPTQKTIKYAVPTNLVGSDTYSLRVKASTGYVSPTRFKNTLGNTSFPAYYKEYENSFYINKKSDMAMLCAGGSLTLSVDNETPTVPASSPLNYASVKYKWYKDGTAIAGQSSSSLVVNAIGQYYAEIDYGQCSDVNFSSNRVTVTSSSSGSSVTISSSLGNPFCSSGSGTVLTATSGNSYVWKKDGTVITAATGRTYTTNESGNYTVEVDFGGCKATGSINLQSNTFNASIDVPEAPDTNTIAEGETLSVTVTDDAASPTYEWYLNDNLIAGATTDTYLVTVRGNYRVKISQSGGCITSKEFSFKVIGPQGPATVIPNIIKLATNPYWNIPDVYKTADTKLTIVSSNGEIMFDDVGSNYDPVTNSFVKDFKNVNPVYYYVIKGDAGEKKGSITVIK